MSLLQFDNQIDDLLGSDKDEKDETSSKQKNVQKPTENSNQNVGGSLKGAEYKEKIKELKSKLQ